MVQSDTATKPAATSTRFRSRRCGERRCAPPTMRSPVEWVDNVCDSLVYGWQAAWHNG